MVTRPNHRKVYRRFFESSVDLDRLKPDQAALMRQCGSWLEALASGYLAPYTAAQTRFVNVAKGLASPESPHELAWSAYQAILNLKAEKDYKELDLQIRNRSLPIYTLMRLLELSYSNAKVLSAEHVAIIEEQIRDWRASAVSVESAMAVYSNTDGQ